MAPIADFQSFYAGFPVGQLCLGLLRGAVCENGAVVFRSETIAEGQGSGSAVFKIRDNGDDNDDDQYNRSNDELHVREVIGHCVLLCGPFRDGRGLKRGGFPTEKGPIRSPS